MFELENEALTIEQADEIVREWYPDFNVDDYEYVDGLHVYADEHGSAIVVEPDGTVYEG